MLSKSHPSIKANYLIAFEPTPYYVNLYKENQLLSAEYPLTSDDSLGLGLKPPEVQTLKPKPLNLQINA